MIDAMETGYPDTRERPLRSRANLLNALLVATVPIPAIVAAWVLFHWFLPGRIPADPGWAGVVDADGLVAWLLHHPLIAANLFYFVFVDLAFWGIALLQRSSWLIDPYWTILPLLLACFFLAQPLAEPDGARAALAIAALLIWSVRLTGNYFRREGWCFGLREDWRYAKWRQERSGFWWEQFFVVHLAQHALLVGLSLPLWAVAFRPEPLGTADVVCFALALAGIAVGA